MERHIPLARVQDVRLKQALPHRLLGVVEVQIEVAEREVGRNEIQPRIVGGVNVGCE